MSKKKQADANDEMAQTIPGADQTHNAEMDASFDAESNGKPQPEVKLETPVKEVTPKSPEDKPRGDDGKFVSPEVEIPETAEPQSETEDEDVTPKTAAERAEEAVKAMEGTPEKEVKTDEKHTSVIDVLPPEYAWARQAKESGQIAEFLKTQPKAVQKAAASGDVDDATYVLDLFKKSKEPVISAEPTPKEIKSLLTEFGDVKFTAPDGKEKTLKAIADEYGNHEILEALAAMNKAMMEKGRSSSTGDKLQQQLDAMKADAAERAVREAQRDFWDAVREVHSDARKLVTSGKVKEWVDKNGSDAIKRLHSSPNSDHAILVLDAYKEAMALEAKGSSDVVAGDKKKQLDGLHGDSVRPKRDVKAIAKSEDPKAFNEAFEEEAKK